MLSAAPVLSQSFYQPEPIEIAGFGGSVVVSEDLILTGEPTGFKNAGTVHIYAKNGDGHWTTIGSLQAPDAHVNDGFGRVMAFDNATLAVGSAYEVITYHWDSESETFAMTGQLPHEATLLSVSGNWLAIRSQVEGSNTGVIHMYSHEEASGWQSAAVLHGQRENEIFATSMVLDGHRLVVGSTKGNHVSVYQYADDAWTMEVELDGADYDLQSTFGEAVDLSGSRLLVGAPGAGLDASGRALLLDLTSQGDWIQSAIVAYPGPEVSSDQRRLYPEFASVARLVDDGAWISAPGANQRRGQIYHYRADSAEIREVDINVPPGARIGRAFDSEGVVAAVGLPRAAYGEGSVLVMEWQDAWTTVAELYNAGEPMPALLEASEVCAQGQALDFDCAQVDLVSFLPLADMDANRGVKLNDVWGWTDPETGSEYALVGHLEGTVFVDVSNPLNPVYLGTLPRTEGSPGSTWRDIKVYQNHAYIVADGARAHGMQVFDLRQLRDLDELPREFVATAHYDQIQSAHNIVINEETGFAYIVGASGGGETCGGGLHMIDLSEPQQPAFAGCFADATTGRFSTGYSHDAQCVVYRGPDAEYQGREICIGANETAISISDVTDKANPIAVGTGTYPDASYVHQGWLSEDHSWYYQNDELDELTGRAEKTRTLVWDVRDLADPQMVREFFGPTSATDHNLYVKGNLMYQTNNASGLRVIDISTPDNPVEVGFFDTTPYGTDESGFNGTWSSYPYFESGIIVVTSRREGLFILKNQMVDV